MRLEVKGLTKNFDKKQVLQGIDFEFESGKIYALLGRNGAGKTTFFNALNADIPVDSGTFTLTKDEGEGNDCKSYKGELKPEDIGYVLSTPSVPAFLTAREFLAFFIEINKKKIPDLKTPDYYLDLVGIKNEDRDLLMRDYSHGMKAKIQMVVNIIAATDVLLLDEPLTSLDIVAAEDIKNILRSIRDKHIIIFSTHIMELALTLCDEIVVLTDGHVELVKIDDGLSEEEGRQALRAKILESLREEG